MSLRSTTFSALALLALVAPAQAAPIDAFPPDPAGVVVKDRLYEQIEIAEKTYDVYAVMYEGDAESNKVDIYSGTSDPEGMEWKKLYTWDVPKGPDEIEVLSAAQYESSIQFASSSWFKYVEARALPVLDYDPRLGTFSPTMQD